MSRFHEKAEGHTKQIIGQIIGDEQLVIEGKQQVDDAFAIGSAEQHPDHGIVKDEKPRSNPRTKAQPDGGYRDGR